MKRSLRAEALRAEALRAEALRAEALRAEALPPGVPAARIAAGEAERAVDRTAAAASGPRAHPSATLPELAHRERRREALLTDAPGSRMLDQLRIRRT